MPFYSTTIIDDIKTAINTYLTATGLFTSVVDIEPFSLTDAQLPIAITYSGEAQYFYNENAHTVTIIREFPINIYHGRIISTRDTEGTHKDEADIYISQVPYALIASDRLGKLQYVDKVWVEADVGSLRGGFDKSQYTGTAIILKVQYTYQYRSLT